MPKKISSLHISLALFVLALFLFIHQVFLPLQTNAQESVFVVEKGMGLFEISSSLETAKIIKSEFFFNAVAMLRGINNRLQAGNYNFSPTMSIWEILSKLYSGDTIKEKIIVIEGWDLNDIAKALEEKGIKKEDFLNIAETKDFSSEFNFLKEKPASLSLEGYLFPDTYEIGNKETAEDIVRKMLENFNKKIISDTELLKEIKKQNKTLFQIITMASLLEKEVIGYEDKQIVAGILWKRLKNNWPLQIDATLAYITGKASQELTSSDLAIDSPYNTYKYKGLPKGPICSPGLESIKAGVYYKESPYWFYLTTKEGETIFSKTLEEHAANKTKYLK